MAHFVNPKPFLWHCIGEEVVAALKRDVIYRGRLVSADDYFNVHLCDAKDITEKGRPKPLGDIEKGNNPMDRYIKKDLLGYGTYSMVYRGHDMLKNEAVALKIIKLAPDEGMPNTALREISIMKRLSHKNILQLMDVIHTDTQLSIILEYIDSDLRKVLNSAEPIYEQGLICQLVDGLRYIHSQQIVHRDLKPQNILISKSGALKIADFGLARSFEIKMASYSSEVVTLWYRSPELLRGCKIYGYSVDIWSLGCIASEILTRSPLFSGAEKQDQLAKIGKFTSLSEEGQMDFLLARHQGQNAKLCGLIFECLKEQPNMRITAAEALEYLATGKK